MNHHPYAPDVDPEICALYADLAEIAEERDEHAAQARDLRGQLAAALEREAQLKNTVQRLHRAAGKPVGRAARTTPPPAAVR